VTRKRLFLETMEQVLGGAQKVMIENNEGAAGVLPYLPLPELRSNPSTGTPAPAATGTGN
jgi:membrane protease subunit HflK